MRHNESRVDDITTNGRKREEAVVEGKSQDWQWQTMLNLLLPALPALAQQLRDTAQDGERMATLVSSQFPRIVEKIGESCNASEREAIFPGAAASGAPLSDEVSREIGHIIDEVSREIGHIIVELQFQDAASQRLGNLAKVLDEIASVLGCWLSASPEHRQDVDELGNFAWAERIRSIRPNVNNAASALSGHSPATDGDNCLITDGKVELF